MKKVILAFAMLLVIGLTGCTEKSENLIVLTSSGYEPYEMIDTNGNLIGFDIELMEALALEAGITIEWKDVDFNGIIASLESGQYEVAIAGITPTAERAEAVDFSEVYYNSVDDLVNYLVYESTNDYSNLTALNGKVIGAQLGTIQAEQLGELSEEYGFTVELRNTQAQVIEEIRLGTIDALLVESLVADSIIEANTDFTKAVLDVTMDEVYGNAIAFAKGSEYKELFDAALVTLIANGTLDQLIEKWFG